MAQSKAPEFSLRYLISQKLSIKFSLRASSPVWASEARPRENARARGRGKESLQRSLLNFHFHPGNPGTPQSVKTVTANVPQIKKVTSLAQIGELACRLYKVVPPSLHGPFLLFHLNCGTSLYGHPRLTDSFVCPVSRVSKLKGFYHAFTWANRSVHSLGKWKAKFRTGKFHSGIAFAICTNQFHVPENDCEGLKLVSKMALKKWNTNFRLEHSDRKNRTTFSEVPLLPEIFHWNDPIKGFSHFASGHWVLHHRRSQNGNARPKWLARVNPCCPNWRSTKQTNLLSCRIFQKLFEHGKQPKSQVREKNATGSRTRKRHQKRVENATDARPRPGKTRPVVWYPARTTQKSECLPSMHCDCKL